MSIAFKEQIYVLCSCVREAKMKLTLKKHSTSISLLLLSAVLFACSQTPTAPDALRGAPEEAHPILSKSESSLCKVPAGYCVVLRPAPSGTACECLTDNQFTNGSIVTSIPSGMNLTLASAVSVFYVTDRHPVPSANGQPAYGVERGNDLSYGTVTVSVPATHRIGQLEGPYVFMGLKIQEDPQRHMVLLRTERIPAATFFSSVNSVIDNSPNHSAFIFVHGFNVSFEDAARRTAQIAFDIGFRGAPILYSWPSKGSPTPIGYTADSQTVVWSQQNLKNFLISFLTKSDVQNVYLIAHSMGTQALTASYISLISERPDLKNRIKEIILAAPDIDSDIFKRDIAPALIKYNEPVTVYASSKDKALLLSEMAHEAPRAGDAKHGLVLMDGIETIDASNVDTSFLGHSTFVDTRELLTDWNYIIDDGLRADNRSGIRRFSSATSPYWIFKQ
jgi:esterase/lipase superfamily enzyme